MALQGESYITTAGRNAIAQALNTGQDVKIGSYGLSSQDLAISETTVDNDITNFLTANITVGSKNASDGKVYVELRKTPAELNEDIRIISIYLQDGTLFIVIKPTYFIPKDRGLDFGLGIGIGNSDCELSLAYTTDGGKANVFGDCENNFKVKPAKDDCDAVNLGQLNSAIGNVPTPDLSSYALKHNHPYVPLSNVAIASTPSTVVKRDSNGYIIADFFRSEHSTNKQDPTLFCIQAEAGALKNNYIRNVSKQTVADALAPLIGAPLAPWLYASKINGWTGNLYYKKFKDGTIIVTGALYNAVCSDNYTEKQIATLPVGYRPTTTLYGTAQTDALKWQVRIKIDKYGRIYSQTVGKYYSYITLVFKIG